MKFRHLGVTRTKRKLAFVEEATITGETLKEASNLFSSESVIVFVQRQFRAELQTSFVATIRAIIILSRDQLLMRRSSSKV